MEKIITCKKGDFDVLQCVEQGESLERHFSLLPERSGERTGDL
jgi:hypothetical protein